MFALALLSVGFQSLACVDCSAAHDLEPAVCGQRM